MDTSEQITLLGNAISEGINHIAYIWSLRAEAHVASREELSAWRKALDELQTSLKAFQEGHLDGYKLVSSHPVSATLVDCIEELRTELTAIAPGEHLPAPLFDRIDLAWVELTGTKQPPPFSPASAEPPRPQTPMSLEAWAARPGDARGELVDGRLVEEETETEEHEALFAFLDAALRRWIEPQGGLVTGAEAKFAIREDRGRKPDRSVVFPGGNLPAPGGLFRAPPDIAIEVLSPTSIDARRDRIDKLRDYAAFGVRWYWLVDPVVRVLEIRELGHDRRYAYALAAAEGRVTIPGCGDLTLDLDALWAELERLGSPGPAP